MLFGLLAIFSLTFLVWFANFHWKRRKMYRMAEKFTSLPSLPFIGNAYLVLLSKNFLNSLLNGGRKVGVESPTAFWLGPKLLIFIYDPVNLETVMNSPHAYGKHDIYQYAAPCVGSGLFSASVPQWRKHKRIITPTFNQKILNSFVKIFSDQANILVNQMQKEAGQGTFDVFKYFSAFTLDTICETTMGVSIHEQTTKSEYAKWLDVGMEICFKRMTSYSVWYYFDFIIKMTAAGKTGIAALTYLRTFTSEVIRKKKEANEREKKDKSEAELDAVTTKKNAFLQQLLELSESGETLTDTEIMDEVIVMIIGGSDTTAGENSYTLLMLGMHPEIQEKVYKEVIDVIGLDKPVEHTDLPKLQYTEMVIKETLRLFPIAPLIARAVTGDIKLKDGREIPKGCSVVYGILQTHRNKINWPNPFKFDPLRFLPEECAKRHPYSFVPFAGGPRSCVGPKYAMMAMKAAIATVVRRYTIKTNYKEVKDIKLLQNVMLKPEQGFTISIEERTK